MQVNFVHGSQGNISQVPVSTAWQNALVVNIDFGDALGPLCRKTQKLPLSTICSPKYASGVSYFSCKKNFVDMIIENGINSTFTFKHSAAMSSAVICIL